MALQLRSNFRDRLLRQTFKIPLSCHRTTELSLIKTRTKDTSRLSWEATISHRSTLTLKRSCKRSSNAARVRLHSSSLNYSSKCSSHRPQSFRYSNACINRLLIGKKLLSIKSSRHTEAPRPTNWSRQANNECRDLQREISIHIGQELYLTGASQQRALVWVKVASLLSQTTGRGCTRKEWEERKR